MREPHQYFVYMMTSNNRKALYIGMTNNLIRRIIEHRNSEIVGFAKRYHCVHLVWYDATNDVSGAIDAEKRMKKWRREKKNRLIEEENPDWDDLAPDLLDEP